MIGNRKGNLGENYAAEYLKSRGYKILERNYTNRFGEIDIIAQKDEYIIFAEVKLRGKGSFVRAKESVNKAKQRKIVMASVSYLQSRPEEMQPRYDVIAIEVGENEAMSPVHIKAAFDTEGMFD